MSAAGKKKFLDVFEPIFIFLRDLGWIKASVQCKVLHFQAKRPTIQKAHRAFSQTPIWPVRPC